MACSKNNHRWLVMTFETWPQRCLGYKCSKCGDEKEVLGEEKAKTKTRKRALAPQRAG